MSKYLSANFDRERGDALTITREEAVAFREVGKEIGATILWALVAEWFAGNPGDPVPKMKDPRDQRDLARLIEHQKANVSRCVVNAAKKRENAQERWGRPPEEQPSEDMQMHTKKCKCIQGNANASKYSKDKVSSSDKLESLPISKNVGPSGVANVAPPGGGTFARTATDADGRTYREDKFADIGEVQRFVAEREAAAYDDEDLTTDDHKQLLGVFRGTITKRARQLSATPGAFAAVCFDIVAEYCDLTRKASEALARGDTPSFCEASREVGETYGENIAKTIMGRLKAKAVALGVDAK